MLANVSRFLDQRAVSRPESPALLIPRGRSGSGEIDYLQLDFCELAAEQDEWARRLRSSGIGPGGRVLLMARPGLSLIAICFALFKLGAVPIVIDPGMGLRSFLKCVQRSRPAHLVGIPLAHWVSRVFRRPFRSIQGRVKVASAAGRIARARHAQAAAETGPDELAAILFTSGSTGAPKGVCYTHGMFEAQVEAIGAQYAIEPGEVALPMLPLFALFNPALGMATVVPEMNPSKPATVDPAKIVQAIQQCRVTNSFGSPALWSKIGRYCQSQGIALPSLKRILMAGAPVPPALMKQFQAIASSGHVHSPYGATEALPVSSVQDREVLEWAAERTESGAGTCVGKPLPGVEIQILPATEQVLHAEDLRRALPQGEIGEIVVTGPSVTREYDALPEATLRAKIVDQGRIWHRMGDLGYLDEAGRLWFCGRKAERVDTPEGVLYTDQCEGVLNAHPEVFRTALIADRRGAQTRPVILIEPYAERFPRGRAARNRLLREVAELAKDCKVTRGIETFRLHRGFPVDVRHNAKISRLKLAEEYAARAP